MAAQSFLHKFFLSLTKNFFADIMLVSTNKQSEVMEVEKRGTKERILEAATTLIADNGYTETTTKDIAAAAGVSEMSVFRHYGSKQAILADIIRHYSFEYPIENGLREQLTWELEHDLVLLARMQYDFNLRNEKTGSAVNIIAEFESRQ